MLRPMSETTTRKGGCLCGAVRYEAAVRSEVSACHCSMCRRWCGGPLFAVPAETVRFVDGAAGAGGGDPVHPASLRTIVSSAWAERGFCAKCGSGIFYRVTAEGPHQGFTTLTLGSLDDQSGLTLTREWYADLEPEAYHLAGAQERLSSEQIAAMFGDLG